jgi:hypothetical protein
MSIEDLIGAGLWYTVAAEMAALIHDAALYLHDLVHLMCLAA